jgi:hypothetical protein
MSQRCWLKVEGKGMPGTRGEGQGHGWQELQVVEDKVMSERPYLTFFSTIILFVSVRTLPRPHSPPLTSPLSESLYPPTSLPPLPPTHPPHPSPIYLLDPPNPLPPLPLGVRVSLRERRRYLGVGHAGSGGPAPRAPPFPNFLSFP